MKFLEPLTVACLLALNTLALAHPQPVADIQLQRREAEAVQEAASVFAPVSDLWKRKGGGGGGGKGGGGSSSSSSGKGGSSSSSSGSSGYVPVSISGNGGDLLFSERGECGIGVVASVGSSTSSQTRNRAAHISKESSKSSAGEDKSPKLKVTTLRLRRFGGFAAGFGRGSFGGSRGSKGSAGKISEKMVPSPIRPSLGSDDKHAKTNKISSTSTGRGSSSSNSGGSTKTGSGVTPRFGGGRYYGGGATTPYTAGRTSPLGVAPLFLGAGLLAVYPGIWLYGAYAYPYGHPYSFHNRTGRRNSTTNTTTPTRDLHFGEIEIRQEDDSGVNETKPVTCLCAEYSVCGCDDNGNSTFLDSIVGDGDYFKLNQSLVTVADINGTSTIVLNGTLPNGTTAAGGTEDATTSSSDNSSAAVRSVIEASGYWVMIAIVGLTCFAI